MVQSIISVLAKDKAGIIARVTKVLYTHDANLEDISMTNLESELGMMMVVSFKNQSSRNAVKKQLKALEAKASMQISFKDLQRRLTPKKADTSTQKYLLTAAGTDRTGIVYKVSQLFAKHKLNITDLNSQILKPKNSSEIYVLVLEVDVPKRFAHKKLRDEQQELAEELQIDIQWKLVETITF